jgi:hypothetical protein
MKTVLCLAALALPLIACAQGQAVWRCGPDGRSYTSTPCAEGRAVEVPDARPAEDLQAARERAARDIRLADQLARERQAIDARERGSGLGGFQTADNAFSRQKQVVLLRRPPARSRLQVIEAADTWPATAPVSRRKKG